MTPTHRMPARTFTALAGGRGGTQAIHVLRAARRSRTLLLIHAIVGLVRRTDHPAASTTQEALAVLRALPRPAVDAVLDHPRVGVWALRTASLLDSGGQAAPAQLAAIAAAAQVRAGVPGVVELPAATEVVLPSLGVFRSAGGPARVIVSETGSVVSDAHTEATISTVAVPGWRPVRRLHASHAGLRLTLAVDGIASHHLPDGVTARSELTEEEAAEWQARIRAGWRVLVDDHREVAEEVAEALKVLTPLSAPEVGSMSATFANSFGCVAMSLPATGRDVALAFAHEVQHAKLAVVGDFFPLVEHTNRALLYAPWRSDLRPPDALLQGAYAHLGVAAFWRGYDDAEAQVEHTRWRLAVVEALESLRECGALTAVGERFVTRMNEVLATWAHDAMPEDVTAEAIRRNNMCRKDLQGASSGRAKQAKGAS